MHNSVDNALTSYARFDLDLERAWKIIDRAYSVVRQWRMYFDQYGVPAVKIEKIAPAFRHIDDVCTEDARRRSRLASA